MSLPTIIDIHTHMYPPSYVSLLASRSTVPYIHEPPDDSDPRLIILSTDDDTSKPVAKRGRPIDKSYSSWDEKLKFMKQHDISVSVVSLANPWLDFLPSDTAASTTQQINNDLASACESQNSKNDSIQRLYGFACLPLSASMPQIIDEIHRLRTIPTLKGIILGTTGLGAGLDDPNLHPIYAAFEETSTLIFLHPHYGLPDAAFGGPSVIARFGHVLPLALGFPLETTIAVTRMFLAGVFDRFPKLKMLLAHSGGTLPFLAGRIQSCVEHEREFVESGTGPKRSVWEILKENIWLDAVIYGRAGLKAAIETDGEEGGERVLFGTDHPFFPPLQGAKEKWASVMSNLAAIEGVSGGTADLARNILGGNASRLFDIQL